jgi:hypothetical protein
VHETEYVWPSADVLAVALREFKGSEDLVVAHTQLGLEVLDALSSLTVLHGMSSSSGVELTLLSRSGSARLVPRTRSLRAGRACSSIAAHMRRCCWSSCP